MCFDPVVLQAHVTSFDSVGWLVGPVITKIFNKACDHLGTGIKKRRKKLEATVLPTLSLAIEKAERSSYKKELEGWFKRLKDAYYEAEEAINLLEYEKLKQKVKDDRKTLEQKAKNERGTPISLPFKFVPRPIKITEPGFTKESLLSHFKQKKEGIVFRLDSFAQSPTMIFPTEEKGNRF